MSVVAMKVLYPTLIGDLHRNLGLFILRQIVTESSIVRDGLDQGGIGFFLVDSSCCEVLEFTVLGNLV
jgi:hypothetical protein